MNEYMQKFWTDNTLETDEVITFCENLNDSAAHFPGRVN